MDIRERGSIVNDMLAFSDRAAFRAWLDKNGTSSNGVWILFGKKGGPVTLTAGEALEEALCFGWIDGQMKSIDNKTYKKYFSIRRANSKWSERNKTLLKGHEPAYTNFEAMSLSVKKTYTQAYLDAKTDAGREKRLTWMIERLNKNLKPM